MPHHRHIEIENHKCNSAPFVSFTFPKYSTDAIVDNEFIRTGKFGWIEFFVSVRIFRRFCADILLESFEISKLNLNQCCCLLENVCYPLIENEWIEQCSIWTITHSHHDTSSSAHLVRKTIPKLQTTRSSMRIKL